MADLISNIFFLFCRLFWIKLSNTRYLKHFEYIRRIIVISTEKLLPFQQVYSFDYCQQFCWRTVDNSRQQAWCAAPQRCMLFSFFLLLLFAPVLLRVREWTAHIDRYKKQKKLPFLRFVGRTGIYVRRAIFIGVLWNSSSLFPKQQPEKTHTNRMPILGYTCNCSIL